MTRQRVGPDEIDQPSNAVSSRKSFREHARIPVYFSSLILCSGCMNKLICTEPRLTYRTMTNSTLRKKREMGAANVQNCALSCQDEIEMWK